MSLFQLLLRMSRVGLGKYSGLSSYTNSRAQKDVPAPVRRIDKVRIEAAEVNHILLTCKSGTFEPFIHQCDLLPNQARDKHRENTKQTTVVSPAKGDSAKARGASSVGLSGA